MFITFHSYLTNKRWSHSQMLQFDFVDLVALLWPDFISTADLTQSTCSSCGEREKRPEAADACILLLTLLPSETLAFVFCGFLLRSVIWNKKGWLPKRPRAYSSGGRTYVLHSQETWGNQVHVHTHLAAMLHFVYWSSSAQKWFSRSIKTTLTI